MTKALKINYDRYPQLEVDATPKQDHIEIVINTPRGSRDPMSTTLKASECQNYFGEFDCYGDTCKASGVCLVNGIMPKRVTDLTMPCQPVATYTVLNGNEVSVPRSFLGTSFAGMLIRAYVVEQDGKPVDPQWVSIYMAEFDTQDGVDYIRGVVDSYLTEEGLSKHLEDAISGKGNPLTLNTVRHYVDPETGEYVSEETMITFDGNSIYIPNSKGTGVAL